MLLEKVEECPLCQDMNFQPYITCKDFTVSGEVFHVEQCSRCRLLLTNPRPPANQSQQYYQSTDYISHSSRSAGLIDSIYLIIRRFTIKWKFSLVKPFLTNKNLLDVGCGTGNFAGYCSGKGVNSFGVEPSAAAKLKAQALNIKVFDTIDHLPEIKFSVITLWHVLEHIYSLAKTLENLHHRLEKGGIIFIAVPNYESPDATHYKEYWAGYDVPRHLWHFSKKNVDQLVNQAGLRVVKIIPMKLDAYYVSMLSEKYRAGGKLSLTALFKAIWIGFKSNLQASKPVNYSSLIYLVQK